MISATHRHESVNALATPTLNSTAAASSSNATTSFAQQLNSALGTGAQMKTRESEIAGQKTAESQILGAATAAIKTVTPISAGPVTSTPTTSTTSTTSTASTGGATVGGVSISDIPTMLGMGPTPGTAVVQQSTTAPVTLTSTSPTETEADAYWNAQPAAVQALRNMPDGQAKNQLALQLANEGYSVDTQIMVWGWDPQMTMTIRQNQGYSWVPSYGEANIPVGPGLSMPGTSTSYSPGNAPAGAIEVSTAFAVGTIQNPLVSTTNT